ncbi:molecular chaperone HscC [Vibrio sp. SS-MA-C1-2]|uniref:Hsp70 family protein n=1 Tax=Vibrio sp. SS-MA-C1-2 TaxID=2908646 RepID=UPI001F46467C|nr:molecular chaperone HscC [Vibrio sp. SS-MA-C1-2]UJF17573.1 molecular chaperone HscC [Vibrio sp. SS-MA-C1-2]
MSLIIGIDLGSTNSLVSYWNGDQAVIIPNVFGENLTPSVVGLDDDGHVLVGAVAKERLITHPQKTAAIFKRYMGSDKVYYFGSSSPFRAEDLSSLLLRALKADAEAFLGETIDEAVISVPAYFNDQQRKATQLAGELAGLKVERLINEPTAAALSYGLQNREDESQFLIFDLGGGTFDVSVLSLYEGSMEVNATAGHNALGGEDFVDLLVDEFIKKHQLNNLSSDGLSQTEPSLHSLPLKDYSQLRWKVEQLKLDLTRQHQATLEFDICQNTFTWTLSRDRFSELCQPLIEKIRRPIERSLNDARISPSELDDIILVGGATRMPLVRSLVAKMFGRFPKSHHNPDEVVALGAAVQAGLKARDCSLKDIILTDVCPYSLGLETVKTTGKRGQQAGFYTSIIDRNTVIPVSREKIFSTCEDNQLSLLISIYQGESRLVRDNIKLGELEIAVPPAPAGEQAVTVRYTYDINGILEVDTRVESTGELQHKVIKSESCHLTDEQIQQRLIELNALKTHPRDQLENRMLLARGERLYEQSLGEEREYINDLLVEFESLIYLQDLKKD